MREVERKNTHSTIRDGLLSFRSESRSAGTTSSDFVLQWGNRKRLRCMKVHVKDHKGFTIEPAGSRRATARVDRRVIRSYVNNNTSKDAPISNNNLNNNNSIALRSHAGAPAHPNLRRRPPSTSTSLSPSPSPSHRILRNSESSIGMRGHTHSNGVRGLLASPERKGTSISNNTINNHHHLHSSKNGGTNQDNHHQGGGGSGSSENAHDGKKGGSSSGGDGVTAVWPPKFVIALTNKEKEEDFMALKGSKLPQRPKKRAKFIQRTLNLVSPGAWLCDLTLERYEVREKKVTKKRPRGLKAMGTMVDSDSE